MLALAPFRSSNHLPRIVAAVGELPASARLLPGLQRLLADANASTADVVDMLRLDPTLTARVIALSNRAYFSNSQNCVTLDDAVYRLGFEEVYRVVASVAVGGIFCQEMALYGMAEGTLMEESLAVAVTLPILNREALIPLRGDELFTIGLLHGLGKLALNAYAQKRGVTRRIDGSTLKKMLADEKRCFRATHPEVAAAMLEEWRFAQAIVRIVLFQAAPEAAGHERPAASLLRLGIALMPYVRDRQRHAENARTLPELELLGLDDRKIPALVERAREIYEVFAQSQ